ncbi:unnamed protein product, partial [marine sediment metagenome]
MGPVFRWIKALFKSEVALGQRVIRESATLPQHTAAVIFNIIGGKVLMTSIIGRVTVGMGATPNDTKLTATPTGATAHDICAVLDTANYAIRDLLGISGIDIDAMIPPATVGTIEGMSVKGVVLQAGTLDLDCAADNTGELEWV